MLPDSTERTEGRRSRWPVTFRLAVAPRPRAPAATRGTVLLSVTLPTLRATAFLAVLAVLAVGVLAGLTPIGATLATFTSRTDHPGNAFQAGTVRLAAEGGGAPVLSVPALMPGESVERAIAIAHVGSADARIDLAVLPDTPSAFVADPASGLTLTIDRCVRGVWATTTPVGTTPTPVPAAARLACIPATPGIDPTTQPLYHGPIVPRGLSAPGAPTATPLAIPLVDRLAGGDHARFRVRVSLPTDPANAPPPTNRQGAVSFEWRATGMNANLAGTPIAPPPAVPVTATPAAVVPVVPTATATATASPTSTAVPTATATASPTATHPAYAGYALAFDGIADAMQVGWTTSVGPLASRPAWTIEAWVNPATLAGTRTIYAEQGPSGTGDVLAIRLVPGTGAAPRLEVGLRLDGQLAWAGTDLPVAVATGTWSHLAVAYAEGSRLDIAANGAIVASLTPPAVTTRPVASTPSLVARGADPTGAFAGMIDELRFWSVARTYVGADTTFLQKLVGNEPGLLAHFPVSSYASTGADARGLTLLDQSPNALVGTLVGGVRWVASRAPVDRPATPHSLRLTAATDTGISATDGITNVTAVRMTGLASAGSTVALSIDGTAVSGATTIVPANGIFEVPMTLVAGTRVVTAVATDATARASMASATATFVVDATAPVATVAYVASPTGPGPYAQGVAITVTVTLVEANGFAATPTFALASGTFTGGTLPVVSLAGSGLTYTGTFTVPAGDGTVTATVGATDVAGNVLAATGLPGFSIVNAAPAVTLAFTNSVAPHGNGPFKAGAVVAVTATFDQERAVTGTPTLTLTPGTFTGGTLPAVVLSGSAPTFTGTVTVPGGDGTVTATVNATSADGSPLNATGRFTIDNTAPVAGELYRLLVADGDMDWDVPVFSVAPTDEDDTLSVTLEVGNTATGSFTPDNAVADEVDDGFILGGPQVTGTKWFRARVADRAGNDVTTPAVQVVTWPMSEASSAWTIAGDAGFNSGWLRLTGGQGNQKGGTYLATKVPVSGEVTVTFDLEASGSSGGVCVALFSDPAAFMDGNGGASLGCKGMEGTFYATIQESGTDSIRFGTLPDTQISETPITGVANSGIVRAHVVLWRAYGNTLAEVWVQFGTDPPVMKASATLTGVLPAGGAYVAITGASSGSNTEHKVRKVVVSAS